MSKLDRQIRQEIRQWQQEGLITDEQADALRLRYPEGEAREWSRIVPMAAGAVIFGLGIILFFAYNWEGMHRFVKLGFIAIGLVGLHGAGAYFGGRNANPALRDSLHLAGTMFFGAGIWLVAQIYHIDEHYPNAFLIWSVAALAVAWTLPSMSHGLLAVALGTWWRVEGLFATPLYGDEYHGARIASLGFGEILRTFDTVGTHVPLPTMQRACAALLGHSIATRGFGVSWTINAYNAVFLVVALLLRRPTDAPSIEKRATHGYSKGFKALMLICLIAHTAFFTAYAYGFATDDSTVWHVGVWEFGAFAILAWWLVLEAFFTVGWVDSEGILGSMRRPKTAR